MPKEVKICGSRNATSNFVTHLKRKHGERTLNEYINYSKTHKRPKRQSFSSGNRQSLLSQDDFNRHVAYFIHSMTPLQNVDNPYFKNIFDYSETSRSGLSVMSRRALGRCINDSYEKKLTDLKKRLRDIKTVFITAGIWSGKASMLLGCDVSFVNVICQSSFRLPVVVAKI